MIRRLVLVVLLAVGVMVVAARTRNCNEWFKRLPWEQVVQECRTHEAPAQPVRRHR